ncbi:Sodium channel and clathrin linker 1 [Desmophyllum pertusum]|uniref:Sodium channel and clathrin linker 1 n=1 Tax=Desmophyllum pertusum TaxID=174260 RepID=A0A9X0D8M4_9CNID|nr:Sodium channel and clathrin linker 1 [Desmophyllum pertusum]
MSSSLRDEDYIKFLQDQVRRLNGVLEEYQKKYLPVKEPEVKGSEPLPPWITNSSILSPLLAEYDNNIQTSQEQVLFLKEELSSLKQKTDHVVQENTRLHEELRRSIEAQMEIVRQGEGSGVEKEVMENMRHQLQLLSQERDSYVELWQNACSELEKIQEIEREKDGDLKATSRGMASLQNDLHKARQFAEELQSVNRKLRMEHEKFLTTAQTQDQEIDEVRSDFEENIRSKFYTERFNILLFLFCGRRCKTELKSSKAQNEELRRTLEIMEGQIRARDRERGDGINKEQSVDDTRVEQQQTALLQLESRLAATLKEVGRLRSDKTELEERLEVLQKRSCEQEQREFEAISHVRDSVQMVENAILERDQALVREQQKTQEVSRLQEVINRILREAGKRTREEVDSVRNQCNKNIQKLMEEMHFLEMEGAEKQAQLERSLREKSAVEKELEKLYQEGPSEIARTGMTFDELQKRTGQAERTRDEALRRVDSLNSTLKKMETKHEQDRCQGASESGELRRRIKQLEEENEEMSDNRLELIDEIDKRKRELLSSKQAKEAAEHQCITEVASLKQQHELREREFESRLRNVEEMNRQSVNELREMLNGQQKLGSQWKEESKAVTHKFEQTVNELRQEINKQKRRNDELNSQVNEERQKREQLESKLSSTKLSQEKLQSMVVDSETRADAASSQVTTLLNRERQLLQERKLLNREFEKLKLEKSRPAGSNRIWEPPQRLSDLLNTANTGASIHEPAVRLDLMSPRDDGGYSRELDGIGSRMIQFNGISRDRVIL